jgi:hypothetical protein
MSSSIKNFIIFIIAMFAGGLLVMGIEMVVQKVISSAEHMDPRRLALIVLAHGMGAFLSGWIISRFSISASNIWIWVTALLWTLVGVLNLVSNISYPFWFAIADTCIYLPMTILGSKISGQRV